MRVLKFRAWDGEKMHKAFDLTANPKYWWTDNKDYPLMQYTGYNDEEWTEIYEGDIVEFIDYNFGDVDYNCTGEVIFEDGTWHITNSISVSELDNYDGGAIRVIGNIYENKELVRCRENERD